MFLGVNYPEPLLTCCWWPGADQTETRTPTMASRSPTASMSARILSQPKGAAAKPANGKAVSIVSTILTGRHGYVKDSSKVCETIDDMQGDGEKTSLYKHLAKLQMGEV